VPLRTIGEEVELTCPEVVVEYHKYMRGVDLFSQHQSYYAIGRRAKKWWPRLAWFLIDVGLINSRILYNIHTNSNLSQKKFREMLMQELVGSFHGRKKRGRPYANHKPPTDDAEHTPTHRAVQKDCVVCRKQHRTSSGRHVGQTRDGCEECDVAVHFSCWKKHVHPQQSSEEDEDNV
jgi:hypothetical protein